jgi:regulator of nucleoside diphosphate kinase
LPCGPRSTVGKRDMTITDRDRRRLGYLLTCERSAAFGNPHSRAELEARIEDATSVPAERASAQLVTMNSTIVIVDLETKERARCTLVYPEDRDFIRNSVGVLQPLGRSLLGRSVGEVIEVQEQGRVSRFCVESMVYQPEAAGASHL